MASSEAQKVKEIIRDAGGEVIGRTRLQKIGYILFSAGLEDDFDFSYKHYGPFSDELANAAREAGLLGLITEKEQVANWGGSYSVFRASGQIPADVPAARRQVAKLAAKADAVALELAATALFLVNEGIADAWEETQRRKPEKADAGRLDAAKSLYEKLRAINTPHSLPEIV
jgi:uncharacterized protein